MKCEDCKFWQKSKQFGNDNLGWCQRFPPVMTIGQFSKGLKWEEGFVCGLGIWPLVKDDELCGEFEPTEIKPGAQE